MKNLTRMMVVLLACTDVVSAEPKPVPEATARRVAALARELPPRHTVRHYQKRFYEALRLREEANAQFEKKELDRVVKITAELRKLPTTGTSVFGYPGLLAAGEISYVILSGGDPFTVDSQKEDPTVWGYALDIGVPGVTHQEFRILFNDGGLITGIRGVPNKR